MMDISVGTGEEKKMRKKQREIQQHEASMGILSHDPSEDDMSVDTTTTSETTSPTNLIGDSDPFELAYVQPVIRANPHARPEQPFPPAQLGREEVLLGNSAAGSTVGDIGEDDAYDDSATVRVKYHNQYNRRQLNK
eukprot:scaffold46383_cov270-Skeletonema_marinoi.AAC.1